MDINRRDFMKACAVTAGQAVIAGCAGKYKAMEPTAGNAKPVSDDGKPMPRRTLGRTGRQVSVIGLGGIVVMTEEQKTADKVVADAIEHGVDYFDVAPTYGDAELKLGPALKPYRKNVFLACKSTHRDRKAIEEEMAKSFQRLQTDHFDLYQLHGLVDVDKDVKPAFAKGGAMEAILEARKQGKIRYIGFSAHTPEAAMAALKEFDFDTIMYPVNFCTHFRSGFECEPLAEAKRRNLGIIAIKALARQKWPEHADRGDIKKVWYQPLTNPDQARLALYWTMEQGVSVALPPGEEKFFRWAMAFAPNYRPLDREQLAYLHGMAEGLDPIFPPTPTPKKT